MTLQINPLSQALGAEVIGLNLSIPMSSAIKVVLQQAFLEHHLLCFRGKRLKSTDLVNVARNFGEPQLQLLRNQRDNDAPEVSILDSTYVNEEDKPADLMQMRLTGWHTDDSYFERPAKATLLQSLEIPDCGGQTSFCNTQKAYRELSRLEQTQLEGLHAAHRYETARAAVPPKKRSQVEVNETPEVVHPLVRTHDDTGKKAFYFNSNRTDRVLDLKDFDSETLLDWIGECITKPCNRYDHEWHVGDLLIWDNRCLVHSVNMDFPVGQRRLHQRVLLKGSRPV